MPVASVTIEAHVDVQWLGLTPEAMLMSMGELALLLPLKGDLAPSLT